jgi:hypothetical protein
VAGDADFYWANLGGWGNISRMGMSVGVTSAPRAAITAFTASAR